MNKILAKSIRHSSTNVASAALIGFLLAPPAFAAMFGENDYRPADDADLLYYQHMDEDLKNIVSRTVQVNVGSKGFGSGLIVGSNGQCDGVITAKHNLHYSYKKSNGTNKGKMIYPGESLWVGSTHIRSFVTTQRQRFVEKWAVRDEATVIGIEPVSQISCPAIPVIFREDMKDLRDFQNCRLIGYPTKVKMNPDGTRGGTTPYSGIPGGNFTKNKRGIAKCQIRHVSKHGKIYHDCDSLPGASGGPIVCKVNNEWSYVGTNYGGTCKKNGQPVKNCFSTIRGPEFSYKKGDSDNNAFGSAGSFGR